ncbi:hypothetical protein SteCoe_1474 [Stentor coeruleus]|uniref:Uncharacterized protein n=1 Tax=Stentor coeruleus TaxID=5963 RepID=A0A1R2D1X8_9CILI|nr:hypothetical protein SteCoe_1474 [Stentor coeruleus]
MGSQCGRLCCRPCKKQLTIKQRVSNIYEQAPIEITENYCKNKASKISDYLKDRKNQISKCIREFKKKISQITPNSSAESQRTILLSLYTLRVLTENFEDFLPITYHLILQTMKMNCFQALKTPIYKTIEFITLLYPDKEINILEDIMSELIRYLTELKNVEDEEIKLLSNIIKPLQAKIAGNTYFDWQKPIRLILEKIIAKEDCLKELSLLTSFSEILCDANATGQQFVHFLIQYLHENKEWGDKSSQIFKAIIKGKNNFFRDQSSTVFKELLEYIKKNEKIDPLSVADCLKMIIDNSQTINTQHYSDMFESVIKNIIRSDTDIGERILESWINKADVQSYFKLFKNLVYREKIQSTYKQMLFVCKKRIDNEFSKPEFSETFLLPLFDIIYYLVNQIKEKHEPSKLKELSYLISKISAHIKFKNYDIQTICILIVKIVKSEENNLSIFKYLLKIILSVINQNSPEHVRSVISLIVKLKGFLSNTNSFYIGIFLWTTLKAAGIAYKNKAWVDFVDSTANENLKIEPFRTSLLNTDEFMSIMMNTRSIFKKHNTENTYFDEDIFNFDKIIDKKNDLIVLDDEDKEDYLGFNHSDTEFSSVSSFDYQDRVIDVQEIKPEIVINDYKQALLLQEEEDKKLIENLKIEDSNTPGNHSD